MHRIAGDNKAVIGGIDYFTNGPPGTDLEDDWLNAVQEEIASVVEEAGLTLKTAGTDTRDQLEAAMYILSNEYVAAKRSVASGTPGQTAVASTWTPLEIDTIATNISGASLATNQITLPAGTYKIKAFCPGTAVGEHKAKLYNVTDASDEIVGSSSYAKTFVTSQSVSVILGVFTITSAKVFEIRHNVTQGFTTFGTDSTFGVVEVYPQIEIIKIAD